MATTGKDKWKKYFQDKEVETYVKANSSNSKDKNYVHDITGTRTSRRLEHGHPITIKQTDIFSKLVCMILSVVTNFIIFRPFHNARLWS